VFGHSTGLGTSTGEGAEIHKELGISSLEELEHEARQDQLKPVKGLGGALQAKILQGIDMRRCAEGQRHIHRAAELLKAAETTLKKSGTTRDRLPGAFASVKSAVYILQQQRRRTSLTRLAAFLQKRTVPVWVSPLHAHAGIPVIGDRRKGRVERGAQIAEQVGERISEVPAYHLHLPGHLT
jgi:hypothetical protein